MLKLNIGSGGEKLEGHVSVDKYAKNADVKCDIAKMPFDKRTVEFIRCSHCLEHIENKDILSVLKSFYDLLIYGGRIWIDVPDAAAIGKMLWDAEKSGDYSQVEWLLTTTYGWQRKTDISDDDRNGQFHVNGFTASTLTNLVINAGFKIIGTSYHDSHKAPAIQILAEKSNILPNGEMMDDGMIPEKREFIANIITEKCKNNNCVIGGFRVLEIGTWMGCGTKTWAQAIKKATVVENFKGKVYSVDPYPKWIDRNMVLWHTSNEFQTQKEAIAYSIKGLEEYINLINSDSDKFFLENLEKYDIIFIDGDHHYQAVLSDLRNSWKSLKDDGIIFFHDYGYEPDPDVIKGFSDWIKEMNSKNEKMYWIYCGDTLVAITKDSDLIPRKFLYQGITVFENDKILHCYGNFLGNNPTGELTQTIPSDFQLIKSIANYREID